jgi:hypothetical protein
MGSSMGGDWLDQHVLPQIQNMLMQDAYFQLTSHARVLTRKFNGVVASLVYMGYITSQIVAIRRLCDNRGDVISLRRVLEESKKTNPVVAAKAGYLSEKLESCRKISDLVGNYIAHTGNPHRRPNMPAWLLREPELTEARKAICEVAMILARDLLRRDYVELMPVSQSGDLMEDFRLWVPPADIQKLWDFWHHHRATVNGWRW